MRIKVTPEDFIVEEIARPHLDERGEYILARMHKREMTTEDAIATIVNLTRIPRNAIAYAGAKDAHAITTQYVTIRASASTDAAIKGFAHERISLELLGRVRDPLSLGALEGNRFRITVRDLAADDCVQERSSIPNYFDEQRFSSMNAIIGKLLVRKMFLDAAKMIIEHDGTLHKKLAHHLEQQAHDAVGALRLVPRHTLLMYVHAYQSLLYNELLRTYIEHTDGQAVSLEGPVAITLPEKEIPNIPVPIIGFASDLVAPFDAWCEDILTREGITQRDFIIKQIPYLTVEGTHRDAFIDVQDLSIGPREPDELHAGKEKQTLSFTLPKGAYATIAIKCFYRTGRLEQKG